METIAVFVNDAATARHVLRPMLQQGAPTRWVVVACPPVLTRHIGRWVSHAAREQWRERWANELFAALAPDLASATAVETLVASRPLTAVSARLRARLPALRLLDARRPCVGRIDEPISTDQPAAAAPRWAAPAAATAGLSLVLTLAD